MIILVVQIRAQFSACGAPLLGDTLYGWHGGEGSAQDSFNVHTVYERVMADRIGLQARRLDISGGTEAFGQETISFDAGSPDWLIPLERSEASDGCIKAVISSSNAEYSSASGDSVPHKDRT